MLGDNKGNEGQHIDIITNIVRKKKKAAPVEEQTVKKLYETMTLVVSDLDSSIRDCKKYN